jgi:hypothetical protein
MGVRASHLGELLRKRAMRDASSDGRDILVTCVTPCGALLPPLATQTTTASKTRPAPPTDFFCFSFFFLLLKRR